MFDEDNAAPCIYYTYNPIDVKRWQDDENATAESYYDIYKVSLEGGKATEKMVVTGVGTVNDETVKDELIGLTFDLLRHKDGKLYYSATTLNTAVGSVIYKALADADEKVEELTFATTKTTAAFADSVLFYNEGEKLVTIYVDSSLGLVKFDYKKAADKTSGSDFGVIAVSDEEALKTATLKFISHEGDVDFARNLGDRLVDGRAVDWLAASVHGGSRRRAGEGARSCGRTEVSPSVSWRR